MKLFKVLKSYACELSGIPHEIPWEMLNEEYAKKEHYQTLSRLNERGGLTVREILNNIRKENSIAITKQSDVEDLNRLVVDFLK